MKKLIIFDLDGTLLDTLQDLTNSVNYAMNKLCLPLYSCEQVRGMIGNGVVVLMRRAVTERYLDLAPQALEFQREYYNAHTYDCTRPYDGVVEMLRILKADGFMIAVHTNKDANCAVTLCKKYFKGLIDYVLGTTDAVTKPDPAKVLNLLDRICISTENTVYCGDSDVDLQTAENAELKCISVTWGFRSKEFLIDCGAKYLADTPPTVILYAKSLTE